ncbi:hypothetical protein [uncultured Psychroserpens sp.]|uniref:hypothetical protein n=1 Tax=uncultured Psychroserpens sp. TaxID=255436 RepID=UPI00262B03A6|nr:hypothetical protein [uncultured Psychroserpens sp.]
MIKRITEKEVIELSGDAIEFPVIIKKENDKTQSAVCLKKMPIGYLLGISSEIKNKLELYYSNDCNAIHNKCNECIELMLKTGFPF